MTNKTIVVLVAPKEYFFNLSCSPMFRLTKITITQFKNYDFSSFDFTERVIGICGLNGKGKTNLLDAIYYLCFTKSYFTKTDGLNIQFKTDGFRLEGMLAPIRFADWRRGTEKM